MKLNRFKVALIGIGLVCSTSLMAQKKNIVSAAVEYKKYTPAFYQQKFDEAKQVLLTAKEYIDPTMQDASTKDDEKAHYYNAIIHFGLLELSSLPDNEDLKDFQSEEMTEMIKNSLKIAHNSRKHKQDVEDFINQKVTQANMIGKMSFDNENYIMAYQGFSGAYELQKMIDIEDEDMRNNAVVSATNALHKMRDAGEANEAMDFIEQVNETFPGNTGIVIEGVNLALEQNDLERAEKFFHVAAEYDPTNVALFATMGTIYLSTSEKLAATLKGMDTSDPNYGSTSEQVILLFDKAEANLLKALEIEPANLDANYNLGVMYLGKAEKIALEANQMDFSDPRYNETVAQSEDLYKKVIAPLEVYIKEKPEDISVLQVLFQVHRKAGNTEQALEYKRKVDELSN